MLPVLLLLLSFLSTLLRPVLSANAAVGGFCERAAVHLNVATLQLEQGCLPNAYCADSNLCVAKGCRRDEYPLGYNGIDSKDLPPRCGEGFACPDEGTQCEAMGSPGAACQVDRDDQCLPPPNYLQLRGPQNVNGSVCLQQTCMWANVTVGGTCVVENLVFTTYGLDGKAYSDVRSRDNCEDGNYCDGSARVCMRTRRLGAACTADKECSTYNCGSSGSCLASASDPEIPPIWVYVVVALGIVILIFGTLIGLYLLHRRSREENQIKLEQYYSEQVAYRESLFQLSNTRDSLLSLPKNTHPDVARQSLLVPSGDQDGYSPRQDSFSR